MGIRSGRSGFSQLLAAFALLAMFARAIVPVGYMVAPGEGNRISVVLCSSHGPIDAYLDLSTGQVADRSGAPGDNGAADDGGGPCVFAAAAAMTLPVSVATVSAPSLHSVAAPALSLALAPGRGLAAPPPWSTGPPQTV